LTDKLPVLVTAIGGGGHGEQILKALRLAPGNRYRIVGADANPHCPQFAMVDERATLPLASDPAYVDALLALCRKHGVRALFHGCDPELKVFARHRAEIEGEGIFLPINSNAVIETCMNKEETNRTLGALGFKYPRFEGIGSREALRRIDWFPVVVKPSVGGGGSASVYIAQDSTELLGLADYLGLEVLTGRFLVQEYVGTPEDEFTVGVLHDMDGGYLNAIAVRRLLSGQLNVRMVVPNRSGRQELGPDLVVSSGVSHGWVGRHAAVTEPCRSIAQAMGARGPLNIQCRFVDGEVYVFEINPRFSGTTSVRAMVGYNEPDVLLRRHVFGETIQPDFPYDEALILRGLVETKMTS
jgi:carbamoyl-phosphate synthase large subunit